MESADPVSSTQSIALLGNYLPRRCGIATFTTHLREALVAEYPDVDCGVVAVNDPGKHYTYPECVRFELAESDLTSYRRAADYLNVNAVDVVCLQHEYGIFGGRAGSYLLGLLRELRMPVVTTLHTVLPEPSPHHLEVLNEVIERSERLIVMSFAGAELLQQVHKVDRAKIDVIPHGIPRAPPSSSSKHKLGVEGKSVILTFGLLSPDKGIEYVIEALPRIVQEFPDVLYVVLGATHPHVKAQHGEAYRISLETRAQRLGVESNIVFHNRFVSQRELTEFLAAADIYITPYLKVEQITSGTLAYAVGAGKAVISTPYSYAREMLADDRGILVPSRSPSDIASAVITLCGDDEKRLAMGAKAAAFGANMTWPHVARGYEECFQKARRDHAQRRSTASHATIQARRRFDLPELNLHHLQTMTDGTGMLQHALFNVPRYEDGYCVDDNARALMLTALIEDAGTDDVATVRTLGSRYLAFVSHAFNSATGRFRNFMSFERNWLDSGGSEDCHGRCVWALGAVVGRARDPGRQSLAGVLFHRAIGAMSGFSSPRSWAFGLLGLNEYLRAFQGDSSAEALRKLLAERLFDLFQRASTLDWQWFETSATYENARLCQALLSAGDAMGREDITAAALRSLDWLVSVQSLKNGDFSPIGSNGFYSRGGQKAAFDQQPIDAWSTVSACLEARRVTGHERWGQHAQRAFGWFLGQNHLQVPVYDASTGGCHDGLHADRVNENEGAESTLSFLFALLEMRNLELTPSLRLVAQQNSVSNE